MKAFASIVALLSASAVVATEVHDSPHFRAAIRYNAAGAENPPTDACTAAIQGLFGCLGEPYTKCFSGAYNGCTSITNDAFCAKIKACEPLLPTDVETKCASEGEAVESACAGSAAFQALLAEEGDCDLEACDDSENDLTITSAVAEVRDIVASPHFRSAIRYNAGTVTDDDACDAAVDALFSCLGEPFTQCFIASYDGCDTGSITNEEFCTKVDACFDLIPEDAECDDEGAAVESACAQSAVFQALLTEEDVCDLEECEDSKTGLAIA